MNFCPKCGASLKSNSKFCASCGQILVSNKIPVPSNNFGEQPGDLLPPLPAKKRVPVWVWIIGIIAVIFATAMIYGAVTYPKNEMQVENLLVDKYWKEDDIEVEQVYYDDKFVSRGSNISSKLSNAVNGINGEEVYKKAEDNLKAMYTYDNYVYFKKMSDGSYWQYAQWIDSKQLKYYIFGTDNYTMNKISNHYVINNTSKSSNNYYVENGEIFDTFTIDEDKSEILSIDEDELTVRNTLVMGSVKMVTKITYKKSSEFSHDTKQLKSYLSIFELGNGFTNPSNNATTQPENYEMESATADTAAVAVDSAAAY
jgi:hypothetical protein